ncbi:hypothetical protein AVEN_266692-1 [Araneus ventricosus]|uniref:Uncharacterized protein n=1 Tax=Araneus ventricosus TaxID=182803 RepID=A0A4Y2QNP2_ARAVE|nr:hypothetical protein AVEN_266692-1 [Araneus ventricosus]
MGESSQNSDPELKGILEGALREHLNLQIQCTSRTESGLHAERSATCSHVFCQEGHIKETSATPFEGPFPLKKRQDKILVLVNGQEEVIGGQVETCCPTVQIFYIRLSTVVKCVFVSPWM